VKLIIFYAINWSLSVSLSSSFRPTNCFYLSVFFQFKLYEILNVVIKNEQTRKFKKSQAVP
jgi:hypothetical protein